MSRCARNSRSRGQQVISGWSAIRRRGLPEVREEPASAPESHAAGQQREQRIVELRQLWPDWGARKLQAVLADEGIICR